MDFYSSALMSLALLASAGSLLWWHLRTWRTAQTEEADTREFEYRRRQCRRRLQTGAMLGLLGAAIFPGHLLTVWAASRLFAILFWGGVLLVALWMGLLALADILATQHHFSRLRTDYLIERAKLEAEIRRHPGRATQPGKRPAAEAKNET